MFREVTYSHVSGGHDDLEIETSSVRGLPEDVTEETSRLRYALIQLQYFQAANYSAAPVLRRHSPNLI